MLPAWMIDQLKKEQAQEPQALHIGDEPRPVPPRVEDREDRRDDE